MCAAHITCWISPKFCTQFSPEFRSKIGRMFSTTQAASWNGNNVLSQLHVVQAMFQQKDKLPITKNLVILARNGFVYESVVNIRFSRNKIGRYMPLEHPAEFSCRFHFLIENLAPCRLSPQPAPHPGLHGAVPARGRR